MDCEILITVKGTLNFREKMTQRVDLPSEVILIKSNAMQISVITICVSSANVVISITSEERLAK